MVEYEFALKKIVEERQLDGTKWKLQFKHEDGHSLTINCDEEPKGWPLNLLYTVNIKNTQTTLPGA